MKIDPTIDDFKNHIQNHVMTINHKDGLFRHLTMSKPNTSLQHYQITTWPGFLCISGDVGCFVFSRLYDMFEFHRGDFNIDFRYWAEKVKAGKTKEFSNPKLLSIIKNIYEEFKSEIESEIEYEIEIEGESKKETTTKLNELTATYEKYIKEAGYVMSTHESYDLLKEFCSECGSDNYEVWEFDVTEYTYDFIWCCYAIVHAIQIYDKEMGP